MIQKIPSGKFIILSGPSGVGKNTIAQFLLEQRDDLKFAISATSRAIRPGEQDGVNYYFLSEKEFQNRIEQDQFLEWAQIYPGQKSGTLWSEVRRIWSAQNTIITDVDVLGGMQLKEKLGAQALSIFLLPPSFQELERRLRDRNTDSEEKLKDRLLRVAEEMAYQDKYDVVIINDSLEQAQHEVLQVVSGFLNT